MTASNSYLVRLHGSREIGRFQSPDRGPLQRGEAVVVQSHRGLEKGEVVSPCLAAHDAFFPAQSSGKLLRTFTPEDDSNSHRLQLKSGELFSLAQGLAEQLHLEILVLEAEILLDGLHAVIRLGSKPTCSIQMWIQALTRESGLQWFVEEMSPQVEVSCGSGNCGSSEGGCGTGGCGTGGCGGCPSK